MHALMQRFRASEADATAIEFALICAIMATVVIGISSAGGSLEGLRDKLTLMAAVVTG